jgi:hypothetical protein
MEGSGLVIIALAAALVVIPVAFIWYINIGGSYRAIHYWLGARKTNKRVETSPSSCSIDADCPPGCVCVNGRCVASRS